MTARRRNTARVVLGAAFLGLAAGGLAACDSADDDHTFYCVDQNDTIVDEDDCDDDGNHRSGFFWAHSSRYKRGLLPGAKLPAGGSKFAYNDATQRAAWGLPATGRVSNGTVKSSVVGKGGSSSGGGSKSSGG